MKSLKIPGIVLGVILIAVALVFSAKIYPAKKVALNDIEATARFFDPRRYHEASITGFKLKTLSGTTVFDATERQELRRLEENIRRMTPTLNEINVRGKMIRLKYEIIFSDGPVLLNDAELNLFSDRAYLRLYFNEDESWIDPAITYRHDVLDSYIRIEESMYKSIVGGLVTQSMDVHPTRLWRDAEAEFQSQLNSMTGKP